MGLNIHLYRTHKNPTMGSEEFLISDLPQLQKEFKNYIHLVDTEVYNFRKTFKCYKQNYDDWQWALCDSNGYSYRYKKDKDKILVIPFENIITHIEPLPALLITEELYQRKNVTDKYYEWLKETKWKNKDDEWQYTNNIVFNQKDFVKAKEYGKKQNGDHLKKMYEALKDKDTFIYNSW